MRFECTVLFTLSGMFSRQIIFPLHVEYMQTLQSRIIVVAVCSDSHFAFTSSSPAPYRNVITDIEIEFAFVLRTPELFGRKGGLCQVCVWR